MIYEYENYVKSMSALLIKNGVQGLEEKYQNAQGYEKTRDLAKDMSQAYWYFTLMAKADSPSQLLNLPFNLGCDRTSILKSRILGEYITYKKATESLTNLPAEESAEPDQIPIPSDSPIEAPQAPTAEKGMETSPQPESAPEPLYEPDTDNPFTFDPEDKGKEPIQESWNEPEPEPEPKPEPKPEPEPKDTGYEEEDAYLDSLNSAWNYGELGLDPTDFVEDQPEPIDIIDTETVPTPTFGRMGSRIHVEDPRVYRTGENLPPQPAPMRTTQYISNSRQVTKAESEIYREVELANKIMNSFNWIKSWLKRNW